MPSRIGVILLWSAFFFTASVLVIDQSWETSFMAAFVLLAAILNTVLFRSGGKR